MSMGRSFVTGSYYRASRHVAKSDKPHGDPRKGQRGIVGDVKTLALFADVFEHTAVNVCSKGSGERQKTTRLCFQRRRRSAPWKAFFCRMAGLGF